MKPPNSLSPPNTATATTTTTTTTTIVPNNIDIDDSSKSIPFNVVLPEKNLSSTSTTTTTQMDLSSTTHLTDDYDVEVDAVDVSRDDDEQQQQHNNNDIMDTDSNSNNDLLDGLETKFDKALRLEAKAQRRVPTEVETQELTQEELDSLFSHDMYSLSIEERSKVLNDMHGVPDYNFTESTPEFIIKSKQKLQDEITNIITNNHKTKYKHININAYQQGIKQNSNYVTSTKLVLQFLRCENYNTHNTALRIFEYFHLKLELFGIKLLTCDITLQDLSKDDKKSVESGFFQLLSVRDSAGRAIMMGIPCLRNYKNQMNLKRGFYYMAMTAMHDESTQKNGIVFIGYNMGKNRVVDRTAAWVVSQLRKILPIRITSMHYCYDDFKMRPMMTVAMLVMGATNRVRFRGHYGTMQENFFKLQTFGIPTQALPITADGEPKNKAHRQWLKARTKQEVAVSRHDAAAAAAAATANDTSTIAYNSDQFVVVPDRLDVLFGRGKPIQEHFGNIRYHTLLDYYQDGYERARKFEKMQISKRVVDTVHAFDGQFLKQEGSGWVAVDDTSARDKVSHAFRTRRSSSSTAPTPTTPTSTSNSNNNDNATDNTTAVRNVAGKRLLKNTITTPSTTTTPRTEFLCSGGGGDDNDRIVVGGNQQNQRSNQNPSSSLVVSDTDNDNEGGPHDDSDDSSHGDRRGKRARLWQSTFHDIQTES